MTGTALAVKPVPADTAPTVEEAWAVYDYAERQAWDLYAAAPDRVRGRAYLKAEGIFRRNRDRTITAARYAT